MVPCVVALVLLAEASLLDALDICKLNYKIIPFNLLTQILAHSV